MGNVDKIIKINNYLIIIIIIIVIDILSLFLLFYFNNNKQVNSSIDLINIKLFEETAINYIDFPENEAIISLKTMYDEKLILPLFDSKHNKCIDIASYVQITKWENKYKVNNVLVCGKEKYESISYIKRR